MARAVRGAALTLALLGASALSHNPVRRPPSAPRAATTAVSAATTDVELGTWMLLVPELNAMPGRFDFDQTEFMSAEELLERVDGLAEAAVLSCSPRGPTAPRPTRARALPAVEELPGRRRRPRFAAAFAGLRDERRGGGDLVADLLGEERAGKREQVARASGAAPPAARRLGASDRRPRAQREKLAIRAAKREARERARLEAKAATFLPLAKTTTREATEKFMLRLGAGLEVDDPTMGAATSTDSGGAKLKPDDNSTPLLSSKSDGAPKEWKAGLCSCMEYPGVNVCAFYAPCFRFARRPPRRAA
ncbi:hypothetical protein SO694_00060267 [Aureococcus anophagefferens]|uniref:Uncharacterized protein n=1 Tax=Aureococcus anophagefferens TaxID=44056 RepID=A0ABR1FRG5_AURAN